MKALILGGTGVISTEITKALLSKNYELAHFNRGSKKTEFAKDVRVICGDRKDYRGFYELLKNESFDVVIDMLSFAEEDARSTVETFRERASQIIVCSTIAAYKRPYKSIPVREDEEELLDESDFSYGFHKARAERYLRKEMKEGVPITILRPSLTFGYGSRNVGVFRQNYGIIERIKGRKPLIMFGDGTQSFTFSFARDVAKGFAGTAGNQKTLCNAYNVVGDGRHIWDDLYLEFGKIVGEEPIIYHLPAEFLKKAAPSVCGHLYYEKAYNGIFDTEKIKRDVPEFKPSVGIHEGLSEVAEYFEKELKEVDREKDALEDELCSLYEEMYRKIGTYCD